MQGKKLQKAPEVSKKDNYFVINEIKSDVDNMTNISDNSHFT